MKVDTKNIDSVEFENIDYSDYPDFCDAYIVRATYQDGTELTESELEFLNFECKGFVYQRLMEHLY